ncbi:eukaryotic long-chain fatty acid CoA synthetase (LC-FACS) [Lipomyces oligophaga]|uniref:eukaryotic long-chain fatty acid CoA synthetase (LC-FACS) n=1 Tax=Lipomyces oligophaga TaxID=45792 RepID=UPI0034CF407B
MSLSEFVKVTSPDLVGPKSVFPADSPIPTMFDIVRVEAGKGNPQALPIPGSQEKGYSPIYRNAASLDGPIERLHPAIGTMYDAFENTVRNFTDSKCLGHREYMPQYKKWSHYIWETYGQVAERRTDFGSGLVKLARDVVGMADPQKFPVAIYSPNRPEWVITDLACHAYNLYGVTLYDSLGPESSEFIMNVTESPILVASLSNIPTILAIKNKIPHLKVIICMDELESNHDAPGSTKRQLLQSWTKLHGLHLYSFSEVEQIGRDALIPHNPATPSDLITVNFTSGTTALPKGVALTHANAVAAVSGLAMHIKLDNQKAAMRSLSYLPLAHIYERLSLCLALTFGSAYAFFHGVITEVLEDIQEVRPVFFSSVPRLLNRIEEGIRAKTISAPGLPGAISRRAVSAKLQDLENGGFGRIKFWDTIWSRKVRKNIGLDDLEVVVSGSAPIAISTHKFLKAALARPVLQGYGLTESFAFGLIGQFGDPSTGHCGPPTVSTELRLKDVPEMNYFSTDKPYARGELQLKGPMIFKGYLKDPQKTAEAFDGEWFSTGDVAMIDDLGRVAIIDRVKNFFKLAQGEYVSPEPIENYYLAGCDQISQSFVTGDSVQNFIVGIFGINPETFAPFASKVLKRPISPTDLHQLAEAGNDKAVRLALMKEIDRIGIQAKLKGFERVRNFVLKVEPFTIENDLLTPTMKTKRPQAVKYYSRDIENMYAEGELLPAPKAKL